MKEKAKLVSIKTRNIRSNESHQSHSIHVIRYRFWILHIPLHPSSSLRCLFHSYSKHTSKLISKPKEEIHRIQNVYYLKPYPLFGRQENALDFRLKNFPSNFLFHFLHFSQLPNKKKKKKYYQTLRRWQRERKSMAEEAEEGGGLSSALAAEEEGGLTGIPSPAVTEEDEDDASVAAIRYTLEVEDLNLS